MILNVSGRTDIVAFYTPWFINRYNNGFVDVRNPFYKKLVNRIYFKDVDMIVFCTKNPLPIINYLDKIDKPILFHVTLTPYKNDLEPNVTSKGDIINGIKEISKLIGSENIYVRYDPIIINNRYSIKYHIKAFDNMCKILNGFVKHIIISFVDEYKNVKNNSKILNIKNITNEEFEKIGKNFSESAKKYGMTVQTCAEENNLVQYGLIKQDCVSHSLVFKMTGKTGYNTWKERNCKCVSMVDIGEYNSCKHFCKYCYANYDERKVNSNYNNHDVNSSLLIGKLNADDIIKERYK